MINTINRMKSIFNQPKTKVNNNENPNVRVVLWNDSHSSCWYVHLVLISCFEHLDSTIAPHIVCQAHYHGKATVPPAKHRLKDAEEALRKVKELNKKTNNNLKFTIEPI